MGYSPFGFYSSVRICIMSNDRATSPISVPSSSSIHQRRASLASLSLGNSGSQPGQSSQPRRPSITTLGLSGSPTQTSPFGGKHLKNGSLSSSVGSNPAMSEDSITEDPEHPVSSATPSSPFARRLSFGAQALRDVRRGSINNGKYPSSVPSPAPGNHTFSYYHNPPSATIAANTNGISSHQDLSNQSRRQTGERFNWSEALRTRAERAPSVGAVSPNAPQNQNVANQNWKHHERAASIATMEQPVREIPKQPKPSNKPDFFQEKILRGDFMD